jgi:hypothetical protein
MVSIYGFVFERFDFIAQLFYPEFAFDGGLLETLQLGNALAEFLRFLFYFHFQLFF